MRWLRTMCYYAVAFFGGALVWAAVYYVYARLTGSISAESTSDPYYAIVTVVPIALNVVPQMAAAIALRVLARRLAWTNGWLWVVAGAVLTLLFVFGCGWLGVAVERAHFSLDLQGMKTILLLVLLGPIVATTKPVGLPFLAGAIVSWLLWATQTAFQKMESPIR